MSVVNLASINATGVDMAVTTTSGSTLATLPYGAPFVMVKNVGSNEAFLKMGTASTVTIASASAANGMSIPAGAIEVFKTSGLAEIYAVAICGTSTTTLRVYPVDGK
jgi:hypothetical protein